MWKCLKSRDNDVAITQIFALAPFMIVRLCANPVNSLVKQHELENLIRPVYHHHNQHSRYSWKWLNTKAIPFANYLKLLSANISLKQIELELNGQKKKHLISIVSKLQLAMPTSSSLSYLIYCLTENVISFLPSHTHMPLLPLDHAT